MGFGDTWRNWIYGCFSSAHFTILIKGSPKGLFRAFRGLRQGDPLSPFLFTLYAECFSLMISNVERRGNFTGFKVASYDPPISHLQYADDTLLFCEANLSQVYNIGRFLNCYEMVMDIKVNLGKTSPIGVNCGGAFIKRVSQCSSL
ncbi:hypothetical protein AMTRI_Chr08g204160 [Amborella trichopoda]